MIRTKLPVASAAALLLLVLLAGCGSDAEPSTAPSTTTDAPAATAAPTSGAPTSAGPSPEPTKTTATPTGPNGTMLDYETDDESGVVLTTAADAARLTGAPADFKAFITAELEAAKPDEGCTEKPQIYVTRIDTEGWARGGYFIPQCGGGATLWAKTGGGWQDVWSGQSLVECTTLTTYRIPPHIAGSSCLEGEDTVAYTG